MVVIANSCFKTDFTDKGIYCFRESNQQLSHSKVWNMSSFNQILEIWIFQKEYEMLVWRYCIKIVKHSYIFIYSEQNLSIQIACWRRDLCFCLGDLYKSVNSQDVLMAYCNTLHIVVKIIKTDDYWRQHFFDVH